MYFSNLSRFPILRCKSLDGVMKQLAMMLIAYNCIRLLILHAAARQGVSAKRISFIDAMRHAAVRTDGPDRRADADRQPAQTRSQTTANAPIDE